MQADGLAVVIGAEVELVAVPPAGAGAARRARAPCRPRANGAELARRLLVGAEADRAGLAFCGALCRYLAVRALGGFLR